MGHSIVHLPNGQTLTVTPVFGGIQFKANELSTHHSFFPPGWTIILHSEDDDEDNLPKPSTAAHTAADPQNMPDPGPGATAPKKRHVHRFKRPSLRNDHLFISSISNPSSHDFRPAGSPTRQIAMMLWATLWWYFHQAQPSPYLINDSSKLTPEEGRPRGEWRVNINREGIFKGKHLLPKLERMGLIASEDSSVGLEPEDTGTGEGWGKMFVSQRSFWQMDARTYLFTLSPAQQANSPYPALSPASSRPTSPTRAGSGLSIREGESGSRHAAQGVAPHLARADTPPGPFSSGSHLPTFYPPPPLQYTTTNDKRHPIRPKPPRQGETFYTRYIPSLGQYLSFRVASLSPNPIMHRGPQAAVSTDPNLSQQTRDSLRSANTSISDATIASLGNNLSLQDRHQGAEMETGTVQTGDAELLHKWMNDPRVAYSWGEDGPIEHQREFLKANLTSKHSFPVIGCFDGKPFGYFEIYWVKEDKLSSHLDHVGDWDRGFHVLVGEQEFRGPHRVKVWLSALVHYCWLADLRTSVAMLEPRVDNVKLRKYCEEVGFFKEKEVSFPHKQSNLMKIRREAWERPEL
ncbi:hypothetical protein D0869_01872 [Hortaea werneckii]|uniref:Acyltransferase MbtK/IucB-like conserved domain-containing protein n=2 Tax=Hortaea werneckii TaxID=91943 RepID=A0A3M7BN20_HORWE|nr:hypothetical protein D0869_01872 [Hortaea werneckii]RMY41149.1 hypothetical protein D0866_00782 [Hortaea werneckii]